MKYSKTKKEKEARTIMDMDKNDKNIIDVLKFYANEKNYFYIHPTEEKLVSLIEKDKGRKARNLIEELENRSK